VGQPKDMFVDPHLLATGGLLDVYVSRFGGGDGKIVGLPALPIEFGDRQRPGITRQPPKVGEHNTDVLTEAGFTPREIDKLAESGVTVTA
jgi:crotonobetainyl-CoA:carnitine CoA-transferase CaiB-like acyl-CoA transferase